jgi:hypothetical protein
VLLDALLASLRAQERDDSPHLERSSADSTTAAADWLRTYTAEDGEPTWKEAGDGERRLFGTALLRLRRIFTTEWISRGGR